MAKLSKAPVTAEDAHYAMLSKLSSFYYLPSEATGRPQGVSKFERLAPKEPCLFIGLRLRVEFVAGADHASTLRNLAEALAKAGVDPKRVHKGKWEIRKTNGGVVVKYVYALEKARR